MDRQTCKFIKKIFCPRRRDDGGEFDLDLLPVCLESLGLVLTRSVHNLDVEDTQRLQRVCILLLSRYPFVSKLNTVQHLFLLTIR